MLYEELTSRIIKCAIETHRRLGNGFPEVIYQRALAIELNLADLEFVREQEMIIFYREEEIGRRRVDFFVESLIMLEIKAVGELDDGHLSQVINYLETYKMKIGLLINFGGRHIQIKRVHNNKLIT